MNYQLILKTPSCSKGPLRGMKRTIYWDKWCISLCSMICTKAIGRTFGPVHESSGLSIYGSTVKDFCFCRTVLTSEAQAMVLSCSLQISILNHNLNLVCGSLRIGDSGGGGFHKAEVFQLSVGGMGKVSMLAQG